MSCVSPSRPLPLRAAVVVLALRVVDLAGVLTLRLARRLRGAEVLDAADEGAALHATLLDLCLLAGALVGHRKTPLPRLCDDPAVTDCGRAFARLEQI